MYIVSCLLGSGAVGSIRHLDCRGRRFESCLPNQIVFSQSSTTVVQFPCKERVVGSNPVTCLCRHVQQSTQWLKYRYSEFVSEGSSPSSRKTINNVPSFKWRVDRVVRC